MLKLEGLKWYSSILVILFVLFFVLAGCYGKEDLQNEKKMKLESESIESLQNKETDFIHYKKNDENTNEKILECQYFIEKNFYNIEEFEIKTDKKIKGIIIPHHLTANCLIHEALQQARASSEYKTVVLIGPDHISDNRGKIYTTKASYLTPFGELKANKKAVNDILDLEFAIEDYKKMTVEHSISGIVPYIKFYFEDASIVPIAVTKQLSEDNLELLVNKIVEATDLDEALFIASVDFSHYLISLQADEMDKISMDAIENKEYDTISKFTNANLDSPNSIMTILKVMDKLNAGNIFRLNNNNSEKILKVPNYEEGCTSYITYLFE